MNLTDKIWDFIDKLECKIVIFLAAIDVRLGHKFFGMLLLGIEDEKGMTITDKVWDFMNSPVEEKWIVVSVLLICFFSLVLTQFISVSVSMLIGGVSIFGACGLIVVYKVMKRSRVEK